MWDATFLKKGRKGEVQNTLTDHHLLRMYVRKVEILPLTLPFSYFLMLRFILFVAVCLVVWTGPVMELPHNKTHTHSSTQKKQRNRNVTTFLLPHSRGVRKGFLDLDEENTLTSSLYRIHFNYPNPTYSVCARERRQEDKRWWILM